MTKRYAFVPEVFSELNRLSKSELRKYILDYYKKNLKGLEVINVDTGITIHFSMTSGRKTAMGEAMYQRKAEIIRILIKRESKESCFRCSLIPILVISYRLSEIDDAKIQQKIFFVNRFDKKIHKKDSPLSQRGIRTKLKLNMLKLHSCSFGVIVISSETKWSREILIFREQPSKRISPLRSK